MPELDVRSNFNWLNAQQIIQSSSITTAHLNK
jgi:hypothetical protein